MASSSLAPIPYSLGLRSSASSTTDEPTNHLSQSGSFISFRHPGYPDGSNLLFRLPAHDGNGEDGWGIHHGTALWACSIIACNVRGFLSATRLEQPAIAKNCNPPTSLDVLLTSHEYYFYPVSLVESHLEGELDLLYPVCPSFDDWQFPHGQVPLEWLTVYTKDGSVAGISTPSQYSMAVAMRDRTCRISGFEDCTHTAHLVPEKEYSWFTRNEMEVYNLNNRLPGNFITSDVHNCFRLRNDIHIMLDSGVFVFVPKCGISCVHFLIRSRDYGRLLHNRETETIHVAAEFLFARFAWAVIPLAESFVSRVGVKLRVWNGRIQSWEEKLSSAEADIPRKSKRIRLSRNDDSVIDSFAESDPTTLRESPAGDEVASSDTHRNKKRTFDSIVSSDPSYARDAVTWHPDTEGIEMMKETDSTNSEPMDIEEMRRLREEMKRQSDYLEQGYSTLEEKEILDNGGWIEVPAL